MRKKLRTTVLILIAALFVGIWMPQNAAADAKKDFTISIYAYGEGTLSILFGGDHGHTWISIKNNSGTNYDFNGYILKPGATMTLGLWPDTTQFDPVPGSNPPVYQYDTRGYGGVFVNLEMHCYAGGTLSGFSTEISRQDVEKIEAASPKNSYYHNGMAEGDYSDDFYHNCTTYAVNMWNLAVPAKYQFYGEAFRENIIKSAAIANSPFLLNELFILATFLYNRIDIPHEAESYIKLLNVIHNLSGAEKKFDVEQYNWTEIFHIDKQRKLIPLDKLSLSAHQLSLEPSKSKTLNASFERTKDMKNKLTWSSSDTKVASVWNGKITGISNGKCTITVSYGAHHKDTCKVSVQGIGFKQSDVSATVGKAVDLNNILAGISNTDNVIWTSGDTSAATISNGKLTPLKPGTVTVTATVNGASYTCTIKIGSSKPARQTISKVSNVKKGIQITWPKSANAEGYKVYRKTGNQNWSLIKTIKGNSTLSYTDTTAANGKLYRYTVRGYIGTALSDYNLSGLPMLRLKDTAIVSCQSKSSKKVTLAWKKNSAASGYQVVYSLKSNFAGAKSKKTSKLTCTVSNLEKGKTYYFRVRSYKIANGKTYYGPYSAAKSVKVR